MSLLPGSEGQFRSDDLRVMSPARSHCATSLGDVTPPFNISQWNSPMAAMLEPRGLMGGSKWACSSQPDPPLPRYLHAPSGALVAMSLPGPQIARVYETKQLPEARCIGAQRPSSKAATRCLHTCHGSEQWP